MSERAANHGKSRVLLLTVLKCKIQFLFIMLFKTRPLDFEAKREVDFYFLKLRSKITHIATYFYYGKTKIELKRICFLVISM